MRKLISSYELAAYTVMLSVFVLVLITDFANYSNTGSSRVNLNKNWFTGLNIKVDLDTHIKARDTVLAIPGPYGSNRMKLNEIDISPRRHQELKKRRYVVIPGNALNKNYDMAVGPRREPRKRTIEIRIT